MAYSIGWRRFESRAFGLDGRTAGQKLEEANKGGKGQTASGIAEREFERFLDYVERLISETEQTLGIPGSAFEMRIALPLLKGHLAGRAETPSSLIARSGLPRGTAHRAITAMHCKGLIAKRKRTKSGKTFTLHPSPKMLEQWLNYARRIKSLSVMSFGLSRDRDYFFGASYLSSSEILPLGILDEQILFRDSLRILLHADPAFLAMQKVKRQFELHFGTTISARALSIDRLHDEISANANLPKSRYDIVTCDVCWMAEFIEKGIVLNLNEGEVPMLRDISDFHAEALRTAKRGDCIFGLPVQTTPELFVYRTDIFADRGLKPPDTPKELLSLASELHDPHGGVSGVCWNGARGTPVGTTFMMLMADFGQPVLRIPSSKGGFSDRELQPEHYRPALDTQAARETAEFMMELLACSPASVLQMSWYERALCYASGQAAMGYCYTQLAQLFENDPTSPAYRNTGYALHPNVRREARIAPLGGWNLCIPTNLAPERTRDVKLAINSFGSARATRLYIESGSMVSSRYSVCNDPLVAHSHPTIPIVDNMARSGKLRSWPRPAVPELNSIVGILGDEIHSMLLCNNEPKDALRTAQARIDRLMRERERY